MTHKSIQPEYPYVAITKDRKPYTTFSDQQVVHCKEITITRICPTFQPLKDNSKEQPCEIGSFNKPDMLPDNCEPRVLKLSRSIHHKL